MMIGERKRRIAEMKRRAGNDGKGRKRLAEIREKEGKENI